VLHVTTGSSSSSAFCVLLQIQFKKLFQKPLFISLVMQWNEKGGKVSKMFLIKYLNCLLGGSKVALP